MPMNGTLTIQLNGTAIRVPSGTTIREMLTQAPHPGAAPAIGAVVDTRMSGLNRAIRHNAVIRTIDTTTREGMEIYRRTANMLFYAAIAESFPKGKVEIGQSFDEGYYFEVHGFDAVPETVARLETTMRRFVAERIPLDPVWIPIEEAIQIFDRAGRPDRVLLLRQMRRSEVPLLSIAQYNGYIHGPVAPNTEMIDRFKLHVHAGGLILEFPNRQGELARVIQPRPKLFAVYQEAKQWHTLMKVANVAQLNELAHRNVISDIIKVAEALHEKKIAAIADEIAKRRDVRFVFIAGPSSSGKTTFTKRLAIQLQVNGIRPVAISIDNYYIDRNNSPRHPDGSFNFEAIEALDLPLLNRQLKQLMTGHAVNAPIYDFPRGQRSDQTYPLQLAADQVALIEGIHGLNERLSSSIPADHKFKIYVSALTQLCIDDHNRIFTSDSRLIRRLVRDRLFRGADVAETLLGWPSVREGETNYIFPFQEDADVMFDSSLCYEQAVMKTYAERFLAEVPQGHPAYVEALRLYRFLDLFVPILPQEVPHNSILREFMGGSSFRY